MKNKIISALITLFFLDSSSKGLDEKTNRSSWFRTSVYCILTIIFGVFFYRSFQVKTIINGVNITTLRGLEDSLHNSLDTIKLVYIYNDFKTLGTYENPYEDYLKKKGPYYEGGGVQVLFQKPSSEGYIKNKDGLTDEKIKEIDTLTRLPIKPNTGSIYSVEFFAKSASNIIPIYPRMRVDEPSVKIDTFFTKIEYVGNLKNIDGLERRILVAKEDPAEGTFADALFYKQTIINHYDGVTLGTISLPHSLANTLNVFSACDLSQYTYLLTLSSDIYIKHVYIAYNIPAEANQRDVYVGANGFGIEDSALINRQLLDQQLCFNVKLPSMANLQQIRSIVLTAIVSALFSLFCTNLFYRVRKMVKKKMLKRQIIVSEWVEQNSNNMKDSKFLFSAITLVFLLSVLMYVCLGAWGYTFLIGKRETVWMPILVFSTITIIFGGLIYIIYKIKDVINYVETLISKIKGAKKGGKLTSKRNGAKKEKGKRNK